MISTFTRQTALSVGSSLSCFSAGWQPGLLVIAHEVRYMPCPQQREATAAFYIGALHCSTLHENQLFCGALLAEVGRGMARWGIRAGWLGSTGTHSIHTFPKCTAPTIASQRCLNPTQLPSR